MITLHVYNLYKNFSDEVFPFILWKSFFFNLWELKLHVPRYYFTAFFFQQWTNVSRVKVFSPSNQIIFCRNYCNVSIVFTTITTSHSICSPKHLNLFLFREKVEIFHVRFSKVKLFYFSLESFILMSSFQ